MRKKPSDFFLNMTRLYTRDRIRFHKETLKVASRYKNSLEREPIRREPIRRLVKYVHRTYKNYKNPNRINAIRQFFTTLQEEAVPETTEPIFLMQRLQAS